MTRLLLTGYAVASILTAGLTLAMYVSGSDLRQIFGFLLGGLAGSSWSKLLVSAPLIIAACVGHHLARAKPRRDAARRSGRRAISASTSGASAGCCSCWPRWPRRPASRSPA